MSAVWDRVPAGWPFAAGCLAAAACVALSGFHHRHQADTLMPVLMSLYQWEPFLWGQDRVGTPVPLLAAPLEHPLTNLLAQTVVWVFGSLAALGVVARFLAPGPGWAAVGTAGAALFLVGVTEFDRFHALNGSNPYLLPLGLALLGTMAAGRPGPRPAARWAVGVGLTALAYWCNFGLGLAVAPLVVGRYLLARLDPAPTAGRELAVGLGLVALGTAFGTALSAASPYHSTTFILAPAGDWPAAWGRLAAGLWVRFPDYLLAVAGVAAAGAVWLAVPATRPAAARAWAVFGVAAAALAAQLVVVGCTAWVVMNDYDIRYLYPGMAGLAPAAAGVLLGPVLARYPRAARRLAWAAVVVLPGVAVGLYGPPSVAAARAGVDRAAGRWTGDVLAADCTHVVGDYWAVWPAMFHVNLTLADRGEDRVVWGVTWRAEGTRSEWSRVPPGRCRLGWLIRPGEAEPADGLAATWRDEFPGAVPVERRPTMWVCVVPPR